MTGSASACVCLCVGAALDASACVKTCVHLLPDVRQWHKFVPPSRHGPNESDLPDATCWSWARTLTDWWYCILVKVNSDAECHGRFTYSWRVAHAQGPAASRASRLYDAWFARTGRIDRDLTAQAYTADDRRRLQACYCATWWTHKSAMPSPTSRYVVHASTSRLRHRTPSSLSRISTQWIY